MVVCRYFLQGYCKFGDHCRYQHFQDNRSANQINNYRGHNRSWHAPTHGQQQGRGSSSVGTSHAPQDAPPGSLNPLDLAEAIKEDVIAMEEGGQWPLSCYTPSKDFGGFPGFHDTSMEELRFEAYQALASGTFDQYVKKIENLLQATRMKWGMLKTPTGQVMSVIEKMACGGREGGVSPSEGSAGLPSFSFTSSFTSPSTTAPAPAQQHQSTFSLGGNTAFVVPQLSGGGSSVFSPGGAAPPPPPLASNFTFTLVPSSGGVAPFTPPSAAANFGAPPQSVFGGGQGGGGMVFGQATDTLPSSMATTEVQRLQAMSSGFFGAQCQTAPKQESGVFGVIPSQTTTTTSSSSAFGSGPAGFGADAFQPKATVAQPQCGTLGMYTSLSDLTASERKEFTAVTFTLGCVPLRPPPSELCI